MQEILNNKPTSIAKLLLALSLIPTGVLAGCHSSEESTLSKNTNDVSAAIQNLEAMHQLNIMPSAEMDDGFGLMCKSVSEIVTSNGLYWAETRIEPACMDWEKGISTNSLGMKRTLSTLHDRDPHSDQVTAFAALVDRAAPVLLANSQTQNIHP